MSWSCIARDDHVHVVPDDDWIIHYLGTGAECLCDPSVEPVQRDDGSYGWLLTHNAIDGRDDVIHKV